MSLRNAVSRTGLIITAVYTLALPDSAAAQVAIVRSEAVPSSAADALHARAEALFINPARYTEAGHLLVRAARAREETDGFAVRELITAAKLFWYAKQTPLARSTMRLAAEQALANGDVTRSAHSYVDAAFLAMAQKDWTGAADLVRRARRLATAAHLNEAERVSILQRVVPVEKVAKAPSR